MPRRIVLVRHGKAEPRRAMSPDSARRLTTEGIRRLERSYPTCFSGLAEPGEDVHVLSSAAVRTMQTAEAVCASLGIDADEIVTFDGLTSQNEDTVISMLRQYDGVVVAVGHSPSIDEVASRLSGRMRSMLKGEALCLDATRSPTRMPVLWYCTPR